MTELYDDETDTEFKYTGVEKDGKLYEVKSMNNPYEGCDAWLTYAINVEDAFEDDAGFLTVYPLEEGDKRE